MVSAAAQGVGTDSAVCRAQVAVQGGSSARGALKNLDLVKEVVMSQSVVHEGDTVELECRSV